jgi:hypothetical protein
MMQKYCFEDVDHALKNIPWGPIDENLHISFGGKVVFGGDFRHILPVIAKGTRHEVV